jgi:Rrf2 family transcriptional regulator, cysteine metabolism repressor
MRITKEQDYAIQFMSVLSIRGNCLLSLQDISFDYAIPYYFLKKIARQLKEAGLVKAKEGATDSLNRPATEINLAEIIEAIQGPIDLANYAEGDYCPADDFCLASTVMRRVSSEVRQVFSNVKLTDMIASSPAVEC